MRSFYSFISMILILISGGCTSKSNASISMSSTTTNETATKSENSIVYLFFTIEKDAAGNELVKLTEKKITEGSIKNSSLENHENAPGNIRVTFIGKNSEFLSERFIEDPLNPMMEVYTPEGINKEKMVLQKADFSVRFNQTGETGAVTLEKINTNSKKHLITIKL